MSLGTHELIQFLFLALELPIPVVNAVWWNLSQEHRCILALSDLTKRHLLPLLDTFALHKGPYVIDMGNGYVRFVYTMDNQVPGTWWIETQFNVGVSDVDFSIDHRLCNRATFLAKLSKAFAWYGFINGCAAVLKEFGWQASFSPSSWLLPNPMSNIRFVQNGDICVVQCVTQTDMIETQWDEGDSNKVQQQVSSFAQRQCKRNDSCLLD
jgi:hypothetical protein